MRWSLNRSCNDDYTITPHRQGRLASLARVGQAATARVYVPSVHTKSLRGIPEIRQFFRTNEVPVYFVSATAFNLLGIDRWVRSFRFVE